MSVATTTTLRAALSTRLALPLQRCYSDVMQWLPTLTVTHKTIITAVLMFTLVVFNEQVMQIVDAWIGFWLQDLG